MRPQSALPLLLLAGPSLTLASCAASAQSRPFARLNAIVWDETDAEVSAVGYGSFTGESDHKSVELAGGVSRWDAAGRKASTLEVLLAKSEFYELDALEVSAGGRFFLGGTESFRPFGAVHAVLTDLDMDLGTQIGLRAGIGAEIPIGPQFFLDFSLSYLLPLVAAEDDVFGLIESELDGVSLRVGGGLDF